MNFFGRDQSSTPRIPPVPDTIRDTLKHINEDVDSNKVLIDIANQILETHDDTADTGDTASTSDDDKVKAFLNKIKSNPEYIKLLKDITRRTIEAITTQSSTKEMAYVQLILRANESDNKEPARRYMIQARMYFKSIGDETRARFFEGSLEDFITRARSRARSREQGVRRSRKTRRLNRKTTKQTRKVSK